MIPFFRPSIGHAETQAATDCISRGWLTSGLNMKLFEERAGSYVKAKHFVSLNSATAGLHLTLLSLKLQPEDEVIVPAITFVASAEVVLAVGAKVALCDVDFATRNITLASVKAAYRHGKTKVIMMVHFAGQPPEDYVQICNFADEHGIKVIEDAAHTFGAKYLQPELGMVGSSTLSYATVFSFYATKCITTGGEGGAVATSNEDLAEYLKKVRLHGISRDVFSRYTADTAQWEYDVTEIGWKYNMTDIAAAIGLAQLRRVENFAAKRKAICDRYDAELVSGFVPQHRDSVAHCNHLYTVTVDKDRNELINAMSRQGVVASVHFKPIYRLTAYATDIRLPNSEKYWLSCISLPVYPSLTYEEQTQVIETCNEVYAKL